MPESRISRKSKRGKKATPRANGPVSRASKATPKAHGNYVVFDDSYADLGRHSTFGKAIKAAEAVNAKTVQLHDAAKLNKGDPIAWRCVPSLAPEWIPTAWMS